MTDRTRVLAARWIFPISSEPMQGGWVRLQDKEIVEIGRGSPPSGAEDLGDVALLPGLVNAHTHLEFSDCETPIGDPGVALHDWIGQVIAARRGTTPESQQQAITAGLRESREAGVVLIGEITTPPCQYPNDIDRPQLVKFAEVLGLTSERAHERLEAATRFNIENVGGWSPHAPYSTTLRLIDGCVDLARRHDQPLAMHVAESPAERELLTTGGGPFAASLRSLGVWQDDLFPWSDHPFIDLINRLAAAPRALIVHGNDLNPNEILKLAEHPQMTVVYCPRTHAFFEYDRHPIDQLIKAGVRVALGTDSRASNPDLNLWKEVQYILRHHQDVSPDRVLAMATINGAEAFGRQDMGRIALGCRPGFGVVHTTATTTGGVFRDLSLGPFISVD